MSSPSPDHYQHVKETILKLNDPSILLRHMEEGVLFQDLLCLSNENMERLYHDARKLFEEGRHSDAADAFLCLTTLNPYVSAYWLGLGLAEQAHRACYAALVAYAMAIVCDESNPTPYYYAASCHYLNNDIDEALQSVEMALDKAGESALYSDIRTRALNSRMTLLDKKRQSNPDFNAS